MSTVPSDGSVSRQEPDDVPTVPLKPAAVGDALKVPPVPTAKIQVDAQGAQPNAKTALQPDLDSVTSAEKKRSYPWPAVAGYELLGELGRGGMGIVFKAKQMGLNRVVALKVMLGGPFADRTFQRRFQSEAEAIARLQHPNIVQIFATGTQDSTLGQEYSFPYFSQEYVDGGNLAEWMCGKPLPALEAAAVVETLARAVQYAHERGIVHRDLKPANILLAKPPRVEARPVQQILRPELLQPAREPPARAADRPISDFTLKIADFGLAKQLDDSRSAVTAQGMVIGTPEYMAPEQISGETPGGPLTDLYELGIILYELLTGRRPFQGTTALETMLQVQQQEPVAPSRLQPKIPRDLETICLKCIRKKAQDRYPTALALAEDLHRFLDGKPILARPASTTERVWRWMVRHPTNATLMGLVVLLLLGGSAGITVAWLHALDGWQKAQEESTRAQKQHQQAQQARDEAETLLYFSRVARADHERQLNHPADAAQLLQLCLPATERMPDRRGWEWHYLKGLLDADLMSLSSIHRDAVAEVAFSPDGRHLATAGGSPFHPLPPDQVQVWEIWGSQSGQCVQRYPHPKRVLHVVYTPDGQRLVWAGIDGMVRAADATTGKDEITRALPTGFTSAFLSPDGKHYASFGGAGEVRVWEVASGREVFSAPVGKRDLLSICFGADGARLAVCTRNGLHLWQIGSGQKLRVLPNDLPVRSIPAFSPDGQLIALGANLGTVRIWEVATGKLANSLAGHAGDVLAVAFSPNNNQLATAGADGTVRLWDVQTGMELLQLRCHQGRARCLSFDPSGRYLVSGSEQPAEVKVWDLTRPQEYIVIPEKGSVTKRIEALAFSKTGELLHILRVSGYLQSCQAVTGLQHELKRVDVNDRWQGVNTQAVISADSRLLATLSRRDQRIVKVSEVASGRELRRLEHDQPLVQLAFSGNGRRLAVSDLRRQITVWDMETGKRWVTISCDPILPDQGQGALLMSAEGDWLAYDEHVPYRRPDGQLGHRRQLVLRDLDSSKERILEVDSRREQTDGITRAIEKLALSGDDRYLAISCDEDGIFLYDLLSKRWLREEALNGSETDTFWDLAFNAEGQRLAAVSREQVLVWDVATGQKVLTLRGAPPRTGDNGFNPRVCWSSDGQRLAASNWNHSVSIWDASDRSTRAAKQALQEAAEKRPAMQPGQH